jgi:cyclophilin family peptidyl-prolyl cis-trans isomerase
MANAGPNTNNSQFFITTGEFEEKGRRRERAGRIHD